MALSEMSLFDIHGTFIQFSPLFEASTLAIFALRVYLRLNVNYSDWLYFHRRRFCALHGRTLA